MALGAASAHLVPVRTQLCRDITTKWIGFVSLTQNRRRVRNIKTQLGVVPENAEFILGVVVAVDQIGDRHVAEGVKPVSDTGRDIHASMVSTRDLQHLGSTVGRAPLAQVVEQHQRPPKRYIPVVGLKSVVVQTDQAAFAAIGPVGLDHLHRPGDPLFAVCLDELASFISENLRSNDVDAIDQF